MLFQIYLAAWKYYKYHSCYEKTSFQFLSRPFNHVSSAKVFCWKSFESITEMDNIYSVVVENVVTETNEFFQVFALLLAALNVFSVEQSKQLDAASLFSQKFLLFISDMSELPSKVLQSVSICSRNSVIIVTRKKH